jgi:hypothetical protein
MRRRVQIGAGVADSSVPLRNHLGNRSLNDDSGPFAHLAPTHLVPALLVMSNGLRCMVRWKGRRLRRHRAHMGVKDRRGGVKGDHERFDSVKYYVGRVRVLLRRTQYRGHFQRNVEASRGRDSWDRVEVSERYLVCGLSRYTSLTEAA